MREEMTRCIACGGILLDDDDVYSDAGGGFIHAKCCGADPESYTDADGKPLKPGDPIPKPWKWGDGPLLGSEG